VFDFAKPSKEWIKISPRVSEQTTADASSSPKNTAKTSTLAKSKTTPDKTAAKTAKISAPAVVWCGQLADKVRVPALIISEIAWMGTSISATDEWIEIKNVFRQDLDISGWQLQNKNQSLKISFKNGTVIPTGGFYLLERTDDTAVPAVQADLIYTGSLANSSEALYLLMMIANCRIQRLRRRIGQQGTIKPNKQWSEQPVFYGKHQRRRAAHLRLKIPPIDFNCLSSDTYCEDAKVAKVRPSLARSNLRLDAYINLARWDKRCKKKTAVIFYNYGQRKFDQPYQKNLPAYFIISQTGAFATPNPRNS